MSSTILKFLISSPLFKNITAAELGKMIDCLQPQVLNYEKNEYIAIENNPFTGLGILLTGEAAVIKETVTGSRNFMTLLKSGDIFGEIIAFSPKHSWPASVIAHTRCTVIFLQPDKITGSCSHSCPGHTQLIKNMLTILSEKALLLHQKVEYLTISSMRKKISAYLLEQYKQTGKTVLYLSFNRNNLADFLNVSRTALSREMGRMRDEGLIEFYRSTIKINDIEALKKINES